MASWNVTEPHQEKSLSLDILGLDGFRSKVNPLLLADPHPLRLNQHNQHLSSSHLSPCNMCMFENEICRTKNTDRVNSNRLSSKGMQTIQADLSRSLLWSIIFPARLGLSEKRLPKKWWLIVIFIFFPFKLPSIGVRYTQFSDRTHSPFSPCPHLGHSKCHYSPECPQPPFGGRVRVCHMWNTCTFQNIMWVSSPQPALLFENRWVLCPSIPKIWISLWYLYVLIHSHGTQIDVPWCTAPGGYPASFASAIESSKFPTGNGWCGQILRFFSGSIWNVQKCPQLGTSHWRGREKQLSHGACLSSSDTGQISSTRPWRRKHGPNPKVL